MVLGFVSIFATKLNLSFISVSDSLILTGVDFWSTNMCDANKVVFRNNEIPIILEVEQFMFN